MRRTFLPILLLLALPGVSNSQEYATDPFLLGVGARALGMGSAYAAVSDDVTALYWNAAGLVQIERSEVQAQHAEQYGGTVNHDFVVIGFPSTLGAFGIGLVRLAVDGIALSRLEDPSRPLGPDNRPISQGTVGTSDYTLSAGYSRAWRENLSFGAAVKLIWRNLEIGNGTGYGMDVGLHYKHSTRWRIGAVIRDITRTRITYDSGTRDTIRPSLMLGAAYTRRIESLEGHVLCSFSGVINETSSEIEQGQRLRAGFEYRHHRGLAARIGLEGDHFTAGAGIEPTERIRVDVAFLEDSDLDNTYRISATVTF